MWVVFADDIAKQYGTKSYELVDNQVVERREDTAGLAPWFRGIGYGVIGVFGASAIYGFYVEVKCEAFRREIAEKAANPPGVDAKRAGPPTTIAGFFFNMQSAQAEQVCAGKQYEWSGEGSVALCSSKSQADTPPTRLHFESDALREITAVHRPPADLLAQQYDQLYGALRAMYGAPQIERAALIGSCARSLPECLKQGEKPAGAVWHWPSETIELQPVWGEDGAQLEERYKLEDQIVL